MAKNLGYAEEIEIIRKSLSNVHCTSANCVSVLLEVGADWLPNLLPASM